MNAPPRFRGRVGQSPDNNKFYFEISIWNLAGTEMIGDPFTVGPFDTEQIARTELKNAMDHVIKSMSEDNGVPTGEAGYVDFADGGKFKPLNVH